MNKEEGLKKAKTGYYKVQKSIHEMEEGDYSMEDPGHMKNYKFSKMLIRETDACVKDGGEFAVSY